MKNKYLHVEIINDNLYIYRSNRKFRSKLLTVKDIEKECLINDNRVCFKLIDLISENTNDK